MMGLKYTYADMLAEGKQEIIEFAEHLKNNSQITRIEISSFSDPEASEDYNLALLQNHAETVRQALLQARVKQEIFAKAMAKPNWLLPTVKQNTEIVKHAQLVICQIAELKSQHTSNN